MRGRVSKLALLLAIALNLSGCSDGAPTAKSEAVFVPPIDIDPDAFVEGNLYFLAYHELGHALVSEFDLPVVGREEDTVDRLAVWMMTPRDGEEPEYLTGAIRGWFMTAADTPLSKIEWWDEHGADQQRAFQIACLLYGTDTDAFVSIADKVDLPEARRESCTFEAESNDKGWQKLLEGHVRGDEAAAAEDSISIRYEPTKDYADDAQYLKNVGLLEDLAEQMRTQYKFDDGIKITARECGEPNAYWQGDTRTLELCYELVADYRRLAMTLKPAAAAAN